MSRSFARATGTARIAVVGAQTDDGHHLREALARRRIPGARVNLYGSHGGEVVLSEYAGEARLVQEPDLEEIAGHDVIFLCETGELSRRLDTARQDGTAVIDLVGADAGPRAVRSPDPIDRPGAGGWFAVPHPLSLLLAELLRPLDGDLGLEEVLAVVLRPASDFGEPGIEELREQTVRLLSFAKVPVDTFGRQLAFNIIPQKELPTACRDLEGRIAREVGEQLRWTERRLSLRLLTAPLFYGHGLQLRVRLKHDASLEQVRAVLVREGWAAGGERADTPLEVTGETRACLSELTSDGLGGYWLWIVAGENAARSAEQAVRLAEQLADL